MSSVGAVSPALRAMVYSLVMGCFLLSGTTGLLYQTLWSRYLGLFLGHSSYAHTVVLATFMGGLALGNHLFGRRADQTRRPIALYAWLEIGIGAIALAFVFGFPMLTTMYVAIGRVFGPESAIIFPIKLVLSVATVLLPTTLMGGTLPVLGKALIRRYGDLGSGIGNLYFINTFGAILGCFLGGFYLVEAYGMDASILIAAVVNIVIGIVLLGLEYGLLDKDAASVAFDLDLEDEELEEGASEALSASAKEPGDAVPDDVEPIDPDAVVYSPREARWVLVCIGIGGAISMLYELVWTRLVAFVFGSSSQSFSIMLVTFISGIALGGFIASRVLKRSSVNALRLFALAELIVAISVMLMLPLYERFPYIFALMRQLAAPTDGGFVLMQSLKVGLLFIAMLIPTTCIGMTLPLATRVVVRSMDSLGKSIGSTFSVNTVGTLIGASMTGLLLIPALGLQITLYLGVVASALLGVALLVADARNSRAFVATAATVTLAIVATMILGVGQWNDVLLTAGFFRGKNPPRSFEAMQRRYARHNLLFKEDGVDMTVTVVQIDDHRYLKVNGKTDASTRRPDMVTQTISGHLPMLVHSGEPEKVLVIGLGSGITAGTVLLYPKAEVEVVELSDAVGEGARLFGPENHRVHDDPRMRMHIGDAKDFLLLSSDETRYDVVISEPSNPWISGVASLFSVDFFDAVREKLNPDGLFLQWMQLYSFNDTTLTRSLNTLRAAFPYVTVWRFSKADALLLASSKPIDPDLALMAARMNIPAVRNDLAPGRPVELHTPVELLAHQVLSSDVVSAAFPGRPPLNRDLWPWLEFEAPRAMYRGDKPELLDALDERFKHISQCRTPACAHLRASPPSQLLRERIAAALERTGKAQPQRALNAEAATPPLDMATAAFERDDFKALSTAVWRQASATGPPPALARDTCTLLPVLVAGDLRERVTFITEPDPNDLERLIHACVQRHPELEGQLLAEILSVLYAMGRFEEAIARAESLLTREDAILTESVELALLRYLGRSAVALGDKPHADRAFGAILKLRPRDKEGRAYVGR